MSMKKSLKVALMLLFSASWLTSCAYVQLHKQVESDARPHKGFYIEKPEYVYYYSGQWYLKAEEVDIRKDYPLVHDSVLLNEDNSPKPIVLKSDGEIYISISEGTAKVLQRNDGYASLSTLRDEMVSGSILNKIDAPMKKYQVRAQVESKSSQKEYHIFGGDEETSLSFGTRLISTGALLLVDTPGTVLYNAAIPIMAPFVFFYDFFKEDEVIEHINYLYSGDYVLINRNW